MARKQLSSMGKKAEGKRKKANGFKCVVLFLLIIPVTLVLSGVLFVSLNFSSEEQRRLQMEVQKSFQEIQQSDFSLEEIEKSLLKLAHESDYFLSLHGDSSSSSSIAPISSKGSSSSSLTLSSVMEIYDHCEVSYDLNTTTAKTTTKSGSKLPLWMPSFPNSVDDTIVKGIVNKMTGLPSSGARSFYDQMKGKYSKCQGGDDPVALCMLLHPLKKMRAPPTIKQNMEKFNSNIVYAIRNPMTTIPAAFNAKAMNNQVGVQVPENDWRKFRDENLATSMTQWKDQLRTWKKMTQEGDEPYYKMKMYLSYEKLLSIHDGVATVKRLLDVLSASGFDSVVPKDDLPNLRCVWYQGIGKELLQNYHKYGYEYTAYIPGYTQEQKDLLLRELDSFIGENSDDPSLVSILKSYSVYIQDHTKIDEPYNAK